MDQSSHTSTSTASYGEPTSFIHSSLDDAGLSVAEFRVMAHILRRGDCWSSIPTMATICRLDRKTVMRALRSLLKAGFITRQSSPGRPSTYTANPPSQWSTQPKRHPGSEDNPAQKTPQGAAQKTPRHPAQKTPHEGNPMKVIPVKGDMAPRGNCLNKPGQRNRGEWHIKEQIAAAEELIQGLTHEVHIDGDRYARRPKPGHEEDVKLLKARVKELKLELATL